MRTILCEMRRLIHARPNSPRLSPLARGRSNRFHLIGVDCRRHPMQIKHTGASMSNTLRQPATYWRVPMQQQNVGQDVPIVPKADLFGHAARQIGIMRTLTFESLLKLVAVVAICLSPHWSIAQESSSSGIVGQITDSSGAVVGGAKVHVLNKGTGAERDTTTNGSGEFSITNLPPAAY